MMSVATMLIIAAIITCRVLKFIDKYINLKNIEGPQPG